MTSHKDILADWANTCEALALEYWESNSSMDASDYANESADGCQWSIYYSHAWNLVSAARLVLPSELDQAESELEGLGFSLESLDKTMCLLAYFLTYNQIMQQIEETESNND